MCAKPTLSGTIRVEYPRQVPKATTFHAWHAGIYDKHMRVFYTLTLVQAVQPFLQIRDKYV